LKKVTLKLKEARSKFVSLNKKLKVKTKNKNKEIILKSLNHKMSKAPRLCIFTGLNKRLMKLHLKFPYLKIFLIVLIERA